MKKFFNLKSNQQGMTLFELIIAISIFAIIVLSMTQIFAKVNEGQRNAIAAQNIQESLRYAMEVMSKEMRMAQPDDSTCTGANGIVYYTNNNTTLKFKNRDGKCVYYYLLNNQLIVKRNTDIATTTPSAIKISDLNFKIHDIVSEPQRQPMVTMTMQAQAIGKNADKQAMTIQTTISSRHY